MDGTIEIERVKGEGGGHHRPDQRVEYPEDIGRRCPWLPDSVHSTMRGQRFGGTLPWTDAPPEVEKEIDPDGIATEWIRFPDPTAAGVVAKVSRKRWKTPRDVGWA